MKNTLFEVVLSLLHKINTFLQWLLLNDDGYIALTLINIHFKNYTSDSISLIKLN